jgi:2-oxo-hept-3-ene-1,7-dioate hydratase
MLNEDERGRGADLLVKAARERRAIPQLSKTFPAIEIVDAYRIQELWAEAKIAAGARVVGHKIGLTSRAMQMASKMTEPDYGRIYDDAVYNDGAQIPAAHFLKPRLEVELAFIMGEDFEGPGKRIYDVMRATELVVPALEIIDYRTEVPRAITDTIADNAAFRGIVVGGRPIRPMDVDIRWVGATLSKNGIIEESGVSAAIMGHPAAGIAWLVNKLHAVGAGFKKGQIVLAGSFHSAGRHRGWRRYPRRLRPARRHPRFLHVRRLMDLPYDRFKRARAEGRQQIGLWCSLPGPNVPTSPIDTGRPKPEV